MNSLSVANVHMRTTSSLESFNSALNRSIPKKANFFTFVERLKLHESRKAEDMHNLVNDKLPKNQYERKHYCDQKREEKIRFNTELLHKGIINTSGFLAAMADESGKSVIRILSLQTNFVPSLSSSDTFSYRRHL